MPAETLPRWIIRRGEKLYYRRRVPTHLVPLVGVRDVTIALKTDDLGRAVVARDRVNSLTESHWRSLARGGDADAKERYLAALERAKIEGFIYVPNGKFDDIPVGEILKRIKALEEMAAGRPDGRHELPEFRQAQVALLGGEPDPGVRLSTLLEQYEGLTKDERRNKSPQQLHKWRLPHTRAVANLLKVVGDKPIIAFSRMDANLFRSWWSDRIADEDLSPDSANKDMTHVGKMIALVSDRLELNLERRFRGLRFEATGDKRPPFSTAHIRNVILAPGALMELNDDARAVVLVMIETGARPIEIVHLLPENIVLDGPVPHISIEGRRGYTLKTRYSKRQMPLVGVALEGARILKAATNRYADNMGTLSATVNKFMAEQKPCLLETEGHSLYSFRHAFSDRLVNAEVPTKTYVALMGHKYEGADYGAGPTLETRFEVIKRIAISV